MGQMCYGSELFSNVVQPVGTRGRNGQQVLNTIYNVMNLKF